LGGKKQQQQQQQQQQSSFYTKKGSKLAGIKSNELSTFSPSFLLQETWGKKHRTSKIKIEKKETEELREKQKQFTTFWHGN
jgi:hypothetical protein